MTKNLGSGWHFESNRHALASKGIKTGTSCVHPFDFAGKPLTLKEKKSMVGADGTLTEREIINLRMRMNKDPSVLDRLTMPDEGYRLTPEQNKKGYEYLMNQWKTPTDVDRKNNPFGEREKADLLDFKEFRLVDWTDVGNGFFHAYFPVYEIQTHLESGFRYYYANGEMHITG